MFRRQILTAWFVVLFVIAIPEHSQALDRVVTVVKDEHLIFEATFYDYPNPKKESIVYTKNPCPRCWKVSVQKLDRQKDKKFDDFVIHVQHLLSPNDGAHMLCAEPAGVWAIAVLENVIPGHPDALKYFDAPGHVRATTPQQTFHWDNLYAEYYYEDEGVSKIYIQVLHEETQGPITLVFPRHEPIQVAIHILDPEDIYFIEQVDGYIPFTLCNPLPCSDPIQYSYLISSQGYIGEQLMENGITPGVPGGSCTDVYANIDAADADICDFDTLNLIAWATDSGGTVYDTCVQVIHVVEPVPVALFTAPVVMILVLVIIIFTSLFIRKRIMEA
ncbi:MAG: hypothetical protein KOO63_13530 [Bacteroidales bacterium]|nr:hypothetical protein [Candidatus Latescibacterota bacterium]